MQQRTIITFSFQFLKFVPLSTGMELILADINEAEAVTGSRTRQNYKLTVNDHVTIQEYSINKFIHDMIKIHTMVGSNTRYLAQHRHLVFGQKYQQ